MSKANPWDGSGRDRRSARERAPLEKGKGNLDQWVRERFAEDRFVVMFSVSGIGADSTMHMLCAPDQEIDPVPALELLLATVQSALDKERKKCPAS